MKKILIIGAGFLQSFVIQKAKAMGYYTITIDKNPNSIGFQFADEYEVIDITDYEESLKYALLKNVDGVMTAATDYGVITAAYIAKHMNLPGLKLDVAKLVKDKYSVRKTFYENKVDDLSQFYEISSISDIDKITPMLKFPVIVKPSDGSGSKGIRRVDTVLEFKEACNLALKSSLNGTVLVEDFIDGTEYGVESFVYKGKIYVLSVMGKYMTEPPNYAELGHFIPSGLSIEDKVKDIVTRAISVLGINFGAVNMDVLVTQDNRICIIDVGARMGGNLIGSHIIPIGTGINYLENLIRASVNEDINLKPTRKSQSITTRLLALKPGKIKKLPNFNDIEEDYQVKIYHYLEVGKQISKYRTNLDGLGYIVSISDNIDGANIRAEEAKKAIDAGIIRE